MTPEEAQTRFAEADRLYRAADFTGALLILDGLDRAFPDQRRILYPRARCLAKLGRSAAVITLCNQLVSDHGYRKAAELKRRVERYGSTAPVADDELSFEALDLSFAPNPNATTIPMIKRTYEQKRDINWIVVVVLLLVVVAGAVGIYLSFFS